MSNKNLWFGYLEAGEKSSPIVIDSRLNTANPKSVYAYNFKRGEILEYQRAIFEPKLRELNDGENNQIQELKSAFTKVRSGFTPRATRSGNIPLRSRSNASSTEPASKSEELTESDYDDIDTDDSDLDLDSDWNDDDD